MKRKKSDYAKKFRASMKKKGLVLKKKPSKKRGVKFTYSWGKPSKKVTRKTKARKAKAPSTKYEWVKSYRARVRALPMRGARIRYRKIGKRWFWVT